MECTMTESGVRYSTPREYRCSFCKKSRDAVKRLVAGPNNVYICNECVDLCREMFDEEGIPVTPPRARHPGVTYRMSDLLHDERYLNTMAEHGIRVRSLPDGDSSFVVESIGRKHSAEEAQQIFNQQTSAYVHKKTAEGDKEAHDTGN